MGQDGGKGPARSGSAASGLSYTRAARQTVVCGALCRARGPFDTHLSWVKSATVSVTKRVSSTQEGKSVSRRGELGPFSLGPALGLQGVQGRGRGRRCLRFRGPEAFPELPTCSTVGSGLRGRGKKSPLAPQSPRQQGEGQRPPGQCSGAQPPPRSLAHASSLRRSPWTALPRVEIVDSAPCAPGCHHEDTAAEIGEGVAGPRLHGQGHGS